MIGFDWSVYSEPAHDHDSNEDCWAALPDVGVFIVADGMGGRPGGDLASRTATQAFSEYAQMEAPTSGDPAATLVEAIGAAERAVKTRREQDPVVAEMATTLTALCFLGRQGYIAHIGDSGIYRFDRGGLRRLTEEHTLAQELVRRGHLSPDAAGQHRFRSTLTQSIGSPHQLQPQIACLEVSDHDVFLLFTDGFTATEATIADTLGRCQDGSASEMTRRLAAHLDGPYVDDVTLLVVKATVSNGANHRRM